jgi:hypothetical protein
LWEHDLVEIGHYCFDAWQGVHCEFDAHRALKLYHFSVQRVGSPQVRPPAPLVFVPNLSEYLFLPFDWVLDLTVHLLFSARKSLHKLLGQVFLEILNPLLH